MNANAADASIAEVDRLLEKAITPYIITLGLCESTKWLVREEKKARKRFWKRQITVFALYLPVALLFTLIFMHYSRKNLTRRENISVQSASHHIFYIPLLRTDKPGGGGGGSTGEGKTKTTRGKLPEIKKEVKIHLQVKDVVKKPDKPIEEKKLEGKIPAFPIVQGDDPVIGDFSAEASADHSPGIGYTGSGEGSGQGTGIGNGIGSGFGPGSGGGTGGGEGGGIGRGRGPGVTLVEAEIIARPKPQADTPKRPLNRLIAFHRGKKISFAMLCTPEGAIEKVELVAGVGDKIFEDLLLQYIQASWKCYAVIRSIDDETAKNLQVVFHSEHRHYHIRDWILIAYTVR